MALCTASNAAAEAYAEKVVLTELHSASELSGPSIVGAETRIDHA